MKIKSSAYYRKQLLTNKSTLYVLIKRCEPAKKPAQLKMEYKDTSFQDVGYVNIWYVKQFKYMNLECTPIKFLPLIYENKRSVNMKKVNFLSALAIFDVLTRYKHDKNPFYHLVSHKAHLKDLIARNSICQFSSNYTIYKLNPIICYFYIAIYGIEAFKHLKRVLRQLLYSEGLDFKSTAIKTMAINKCLIDQLIPDRPSFDFNGIIAKYPDFKKQQELAIYKARKKAIKQGKKLITKQYFGNFLYS